MKKAETSKASKESSSLPSRSPNASNAPSQTSSIAWAPTGSRGTLQEDETDDVEETSHQRLQRRNTERINNRSKKKTQQQQQEEEEEAIPIPEPSLPDWLAASAWGATLEVLKLAGGVTLSTTSKLVAPPLHVSRKFLLPALLDAAVNNIATNTPVRIKDWFRIVSSSISNFWQVLKDTQRGKQFRERLLIVWYDILECLTADVTRQVFLDGTACWIKLAQVLNTGECRDYVQQVCIWACRVLQAASHGRNQQLLHNAAAAFVSASQTLADPQTTLALAQVTAYLCYALEMEQEFQQQQKQKNPSTRQRERHAYEQTTNVQRETFVRNPDATVEQVILSSIGMTAKETNTASTTAGGVESDAASVPSRIVCPAGQPPPRVLFEQQQSQKQHQQRPKSVQEQSSEYSVDHWDQDSSIRQQVVADDAASQNSSSVQQQEHQNPNQPIEPWTEQARKDINLELLQQQIYAATKEQQPQVETVNDYDDDDSDNDTDIEDLVSESDLYENTAKRTRVRVQQKDDNTESSAKLDAAAYAVDWSTIPNALPLEGESSVQHFHRVLNSVLDQKREMGLREELQDRDKVSTTRAAKGRVRKPPPKGIDSVLTRTIAQQIADGASLMPESSKNGGIGRILGILVDPKNRKYIYFAIAAGLLLAFFWFCLGCYGLYRFLYPSVVVIESALTGMPQTQEIVIRIVREVAQGAVETAGDDAVPAQDIAECVAESFA